MRNRCLALGSFPILTLDSGAVWGQANNEQRVWKRGGGSGGIGGWGLLIFTENSMQAQLFEQEKILGQVRPLCAHHMGRTA